MDWPSKDLSNSKNGQHKWGKKIRLLNEEKEGKKIIIRRGRSRRTKTPENQKMKMEQRAQLNRKRELKNLIYKNGGKIKKEVMIIS